MNLPLRNVWGSGAQVCSWRKPADFKTWFSWTRQEVIWFYFFVNAFELEKRAIFHLFLFHSRLYKNDQLNNCTLWRLFESTIESFLLVNTLFIIYELTQFTLCFCNSLCFDTKTSETHRSFECPAGLVMLVFNTSINQQKEYGRKISHVVVCMFTSTNFFVITW